MPNLSDEKEITLKIDLFLNISEEYAINFYQTISNLLKPIPDKRTVLFWLNLCNNPSITPEPLAEYIAENDRIFRLVNNEHKKKKKKKPAKIKEVKVDEILVKKVAERLTGADKNNLNIARNFVSDIVRLYPYQILGERSKNVFLWAVKTLAMEDNLTIWNVVELMDKVLNPVRVYGEKIHEISVPMGTGGKRG